MSVFDRISQIHSRMQSMQSQFSNVSASNFAPSVATSGPACLNTPTAQTFEQILANSGLKPGEGVASSENISSNTAYKGSEKDFEGIIKDASKKYGVEEDFIRAIIKQESGFNPNAVSCCGAQGMMQLMPETAKDLGVKIKDFNAADSDHDGVLTADEIADCDDMAKFISGLIEEQKEIENEKSEESKNKEEEKVNKKDDTKN